MQSPRLVATSCRDRVHESAGSRIAQPGEPRWEWAAVLLRQPGVTIHEVIMSGPDRFVGASSYVGSMESTPIILVPGFWLGGWAWDEVAGPLRQAGHDVTALTLPGLESIDTDRAGITFTDHVDAICAAVEAAGRPVTLAVHSGAGGPGYAATDRVPAQIAAMVYVDSGPATGPMNPDLEGVELLLPPPDELAADENLDGLSAHQLATFRARAVPEPAGALRGGAVLANEARLDVPTTAICTGYSSADYQEAVAEGQTWLGGFAELRDLTWVDLPTSHWPMWSLPSELATILGDVARRADRRD